MRARAEKHSKELTKLTLSSQIFKETFIEQANELLFALQKTRDAHFTSLVQQIYHLLQKIVSRYQRMGERDGASLRKKICKRGVGCSQ